MDRAQLRQLLIDVLTEIQTNSGRGVLPFADELRPLEDLDGFDSLNAEEATTMLAIRLDLEIPDNPFVHGNTILRLSQVVERLYAIVQARGARSHAER